MHIILQFPNLPFGTTPATNPVCIIDYTGVVPGQIKDNIISFALWDMIWHFRNFGLWDWCLINVLTYLLTYLLAYLTRTSGSYRSRATRENCSCASYAADKTVLWVPCGWTAFNSFGLELSLINCYIYIGYRCQKFQVGCRWWWVMDTASSSSPTRSAFFSFLSFV